MADAWTPLLNSLPLSRAERETIKRFREDASGRGFLPVADILRAHRLIDESLELLTQGLQQHPNFTVARVILVRELLGKGLVSESWQVLEQSPEPLRDNVLAQKLRLKLTLLIGDEAAAKATNQHLKLQQMQDLVRPWVLNTRYRLASLGRAIHACRYRWSVEFLDLSAWPLQQQER